MKKRAAVVIGVNQTGGLAKLDSAVTGARAVAKFLKNEGYDHTLIVDEDDQGKQVPVTVERIKSALRNYVTEPATYDFLVVFFSGHGLWVNRADQWLLSHAPVDANEAINLKSAAELAKYCGIPNVVFVSDACRSLPDKLGTANIMGQIGFPNFSNITDAGKIDLFLATSEARPAFEGMIDGKKQSVLTNALLSAFENTPSEFIDEIKVNGKTVSVVTNRSLESYLQDEVDRLLAEIDFNLRQTLDINVPSSEKVYIAEVQSRPVVAASRPPPSPSPPGPVPDDDVFQGDGDAGEEEASADGDIGTVDYLEQEPDDVGSQLPPARQTMGEAARNLIYSELGINRSAKEVLRTRTVKQVPDEALSDEIDARRPTGEVTAFESETGLVFHGAQVDVVLVTGKNDFQRAELLEKGNGNDQPAIIRLWLEDPGASVAVKLEDGRCVLVAGLKGYIGHGRLGKEGLDNLSYVPSQNTYRWGSYEYKREKIDRLRAAIALAAANNTFRIGSGEKAHELANAIRIEKSIDPTLGLYAAYAYSEASEDEEVRSVLYYMQSDIGCDLFDVRMLAFRNKADYPTHLPVYPFCPLLTQGWNLLSPRNVDLSAPLDKAIHHLTGSLWTTFKAGFTDTLLGAIDNGELP